MKLSIIIVNYNHPKLIEKCLTTLEASQIPFPYEIIIVDNASEDKPKIPKPQDAKIQTLWNDENVGFGRANNQAAKLAKGEWLLFLNTDIEVLDNAIEKLVLFADQYKNEAIFGGKLLNVDKTEQASCGPFYTLPVTFAMLFLKGEKLGITRYSPQKVTEVDWVSGACLLLKKTTFNSVSGFDESIFMYMDEIDLCFRAKKHGLSVVFYPEARFIHIGAATSKARMEPILNIYKGLLYFYQKHYPASQLPILKAMLRTKAAISYILGSIIGSSSLKKTYAKAFQMVE